MTVTTPYSRVSRAVKSALDAMRSGRPVLVVDGEGDPGEAVTSDFLTLPAAHATPAALHELSRLAGGLTYLCLSPERTRELGLAPPARSDPRSWKSRLLGSIDAGSSSGSGISAEDRARTVATAIDSASGPDDVRRPGHVIALRATPGGTLRRSGYTEAAVDLARLAGGPAAAVMSEVLDERGAVADRNALTRLAKAHEIPVVSVHDVACYRARAEHTVEIVAEAELPTAFGTFTALGMTSPFDDAPYLALIAPTAGDRVPLVSVHRACTAGAALRSIACDCRSRLDAALTRVSREGGIVLQLPRPEHHAAGFVRPRPRLHEVGDALLAGLLLRELGVDRVRAVAGGPFHASPGDVFGVEIIEVVTTEEAR